MALVRTHRVILGLLALGTSLAPVVGVTAPSRATTSAGRPAAARSVLPWIEDDFTRAVAEAKARKAPIFVESWAPW